MSDLHKKHFRLVSLGGTFNELHRGHKEYLDMGLYLAEKVHIYITSDMYASTYKIYPPKPYELRLRKILSYLSKKNKIDKCEIFAINNNLELEQNIIKLNYDLVVVEPAYFEKFKSLALIKGRNGKKQFSILFKHRTRDGKSNDISSTKKYQNKLFKQVNRAKN